MNLLHLLIADYANITGDGKLNVMGIFNEISAPNFPARHAKMHLIAKLDAGPGEYDQTRKLTIKLLNKDATQELVNFSNDIHVARGSAGQRVEVNQILELRDIIFPSPGNYQFSVLVDNDEKGALPITLIERKATGD